MRATKALSAGRGVSRISARGVLKVRPHTKSGGGGGGGGGCSPLQVRYTKSGGGHSLRVRYEKWGGGGGGGGRAIRFTKSGGGGGGGGVWHKENTLSLIINGCNFDQGGAQAHHTRARMNLIVVFYFIYSLIVFILETEGGARAP